MSVGMEAEIERRRKQIDDIDGRLVELIAERARLAREIGAYKRKLGKKLSDAGREKEVVGKMENEALSRGLDPAFMAAIARRIISYCKREQKK